MVPGTHRALTKYLMNQRIFLAHAFLKTQILSPKQILRLQADGAFTLSKKLPMAAERVHRALLSRPGHLAYAGVRLASQTFTCTAPPPQAPPLGLEPPS